MKQIVFVFLSIFFLASLTVTGQQSKQIKYQAETVAYNKNVGNGAMRLIDNVRFDHEGVIMNCDSAYMYNAENRFEAFSNVYINQGDTVRLYGDYLAYNGNTHKAKVVSNVMLENEQMKLLTNLLDYDINQQVAYYSNGARIYSAEDELTSKKGFYYNHSKLNVFKDSVVLVNPEYTIYSDTLKYDSQNKISYFHGPTDIVSDSNTIYTEKGWYNTQTNIARFSKNNRLENPDQILWSNFLYYERETGYGKAWKQVRIHDKKQNIILTGNFALSNEKTNDAMITDSAVFMQVAEDDTMFLHADTLKAFNDTTGTRMLTAFNNVRIYRSNLQAVCDSLAYSFRDSIIRLYHLPVIWSEANQLSSDYIEMLTRNSNIYRVNFLQNAFIVEKVDTNQFNQIKGKNMYANLRNQQLYRVDVIGNGQTLYYVSDDNGSTVGLNKAESSDVIIFLENKKISRINFKTKPDAVLYPLSMVPANNETLKGFHWYSSIRPKNKTDIFRKVPMTNNAPFLGR